MKLCRRCQIVKPVEEFYRLRSSEDGRSGVCKTCQLAETPRPRPKDERQRQQVREVQVYTRVPRDYRISGLAFRIPGTPTSGRYARSVDGDWYRVRGNDLRPVWADQVDEWIVAIGAATVERIVRGE